MGSRGTHTLLGKTMKPRVLTLYLSLGGLVLTAAIVATFAWTAKATPTDTSQQPKNNMIFNWGSSS